MASPITQPGDRTGQPPSPKAPTGMRNRVFLVILAVAAAVAFAVGGLTPGLALAATTTQQQQAKTSPFRIVASPQPGQTRLNASVAISATDVWAVGSFSSDSSSDNHTLAEHWNGSTWQVVATPNAPQHHPQLIAVSAVSSTDVWAAGATFIEHWNGTKWSIVASPSTPVLTSIDAISSTNVYAVGNRFMGSPCEFGAAVEHWNGSTWSIIPTAAPCEAAPTGVSASSASDVWVVGVVENMQATPFTEHFNGHAWRAVPSPANPAIKAVVDLSPTNVWAVGDDISHWNGTSWKVVAKVKSGSHLLAITSLSATDLWAVGYTTVGNNGPTTLAEHFNGTAWSVVPTPSPGSTFSTLNGVSSATSGHVYAVGFTAPDNFAINGLILENDNG